LKLCGYANMQMIFMISNAGCSILGVNYFQDNTGQGGVPDF
jgi:hypothetical protein